MSIHRFAAVSSALALTILSTACYADSPIASAEARASDGASHPLSPRQIKLLTDWLESHRSGWSRLVLATPPPTESLTVTVHRENQKSANISFYAQQGWRGSLMYWGGAAKDNRQGHFEAQQVEVLREELQKPQ
jgi:hypothetical protein